MVLNMNYLFSIEMLKELSRNKNKRNMNMFDIINNNKYDYLLQRYIC